MIEILRDVTLPMGYSMRIIRGDHGTTGLLYWPADEGATGEWLLTGKPLWSPPSWDDYETARLLESLCADERLDNEENDAHRFLSFPQRHWLRSGEARYLAIFASMIRQPRCPSCDLVPEKLKRVNVCPSCATTWNRPHLRERKVAGADQSPAPPPHGESGEST
jgi:hypothetical protein